MYIWKLYHALQAFYSFSTRKYINLFNLNLWIFYYTHTYTLADVKEKVRLIMFDMCFSTYFKNIFKILTSKYGELAPKMILWAFIAWVVSFSHDHESFNFGQITFCLTFLFYLTLESWTSEDLMINSWSMSANTKVTSEKDSVKRILSKTDIIWFW